MILFKKKTKWSDLICSHYEVSSAAVPVSFLIQGLFLLSDQTWKNSSIKIGFFPYLEKYHFERWFICIVTRGDICHQVVTKQSFPGTRGDCPKSAAAEESQKMIEQTRDPSAKLGTELIKNAFGWSGWCSYCDFCVWKFIEWCSAGVWILNWRSWLTLEILQWEKDWIFQFQTLGNCECSIREEKRIKFSEVAENWE